jgi:hypothetical protein
LKDEVRRLREEGWGKEASAIKNKMIFCKLYE